ncbi:RDD family protein [Kitasatospora sp. NPDC050543]|uniref:RDD family protein n=1 Tax=Kitasatospora sp. NPDC050543 TaxID=3364054 RepID=UPI0037B981CA
MSDLVTGEAVVLGLRAAKLPSRALALALDLAVEVGAFLLTIFIFAMTASSIDSAALAATVLGMMVFFLVAVPVMVETLSRGRSIGKAAFGLRVVRSDGGPVRFRHTLVRALVGFFEIVMLSGVPAAICSLVSPEGKRLGDIFAGTLVVRERVPGSGGSAAPLPPLPPQLMHALSGELTALDLSAVPDGLWLAVRQFLGRLGQLDPEVAQGMAVRLAGDVAARTGHPAPASVHPAAYLGAVLAERQRREWARTAGAHPQQAGQHAAPWGSPIPAQAGPHPVAHPVAHPEPAAAPQGQAAPARVHAGWAAQAAAAAPSAPAAPTPMPAAALPEQPGPATPPAPAAKAPDTGFAPPA